MTTFTLGVESAYAGAPMTVTNARRGLGILSSTPFARMMQRSDALARKALAATELAHELNSLGLPAHARLVADEAAQLRADAMRLADDARGLACQSDGRDFIALPGVTFGHASSTGNESAIGLGAVAKYL